MRHVDRITSPRLFLSLGSVLCNDPWYQALTHLRSWAKLLRPDDYILVGMDGHLAPQHEQKIWDAYHSCDDLYRKFFLNGFEQANKLVGEKWFREEDWEFKAQLETSPTTRHRFFFRAKRDVRLNSLNKTFAKGDELDWFDSHKYGEDNVRLMCAKAGLAVEKVWTAPNSEFRKSFTLPQNNTYGTIRCARFFFGVKGITPYPKKKSIQSIVPARVSSKL